MNKKHQYIAVAITVLTLSISANAEAQTSARKLGRGLAAMTCGFLEIPGNIIAETRAQGAVGVPIGLAIGLGMTVTRELVGVYEFVSAPFPMPAGFQPILRPEYPWDYFD
ncbi:exosortase system-associated protein, TIGR04073 family [Methylomarinum sp. Ch1-1]|uniref:Exosortase system-associated protein, TIGR04073 family n=1 Tax=Methylomarinum roseum TaxID=3067653 RepID=A0AAU7NW15_9GAMM|nr:exosortase system-associated protein, TIGR04073 family [Methylomarinum sp. Ch1-1]MDP4522788.1 exosortase system-associated protein, TIGR04073 family [Methylomarinum sp. Ch1-1]